MGNKVSIVVAVYNAEKTLSLCLDSLMNLDFPRELLEIVVVDNNSTDGSRDIIRQYPVRYAFESKRGRGAARNRGVLETNSEFVAFIDADCVADKYWLKNILKYFTDESIAGCGGRGASYRILGLLEKYYDFGDKFCFNKNIEERCFYYPCISTFNSIFRRRVLEDVGLFDDSFITNEDSALSYQLYAKGYKLNYAADAIVYHMHPSNLRDFLGHWFEYGYTSTYLREKFIHSLKMPVLCFDDCVRFILKQLQSTKIFFINIATGNDRLKKIFPLFDIIKDTAFFFGRIYGLLMLKFKITQISPCPSQNYKVLWKIVDNEAVLLGLEREHYWVLNNVGTKIWKLFTEDMDITKIIDKISDEYHVDKEEVKSDIAIFMEELKSEGLISGGVGSRLT